MPPIKRPAPGPMLESELLRDVRKWLSEQPDITIHRNNTGALKDETGRLVRYGLGTGSSDLIGSITYEFERAVWGSTLYEQVVVPTTFARALAIELKQPGKTPTEDQIRFLEAKCKAGWVAFWADNMEMVRTMIEKARAWEI